MDALGKLPRLAPLFALLALGLALQVDTADAGIRWCRKDPVVKIAGETADVRLASYEAMNDLATGPTRVVASVPVGVPAELLAADRGFGGHGYDIRFVESPALDRTGDRVQVRVEVYVPATDRTLPVVVSFAPRSSGPLRAADASGTASRWVALTSG